MATFNTNIPLFFPEMKELLVILKDPLFHTFIDEVCGINNTDCTEFNPPFFYLEKINLIRKKISELGRFKTSFGISQNYHIFLIKNFIENYYMGRDQIRPDKTRQDPTRPHY